MPEPTKPDWAEIVRDRLAGTRSCSQEVVAELAAHLEEVYEEARACPVSVTEAGAKEAMQLALEQAGDWHVLAAEIARTKSPEDSMNDGTMNYRTKTILLPTIAILFAVGLLLLFLDRAAILQRLIWIACMALLLCAVKSEANRLNPRTRSLWLPGFVTLIAASLWMFAEEIVLVHDASFYFTDISLRPSHLISGLPRWFYAAWLLAQVPCGALGAFLSRRAGGTRVARVVAGAFPALAMFLVCSVVIPISVFFANNTYALHHLSTLAFGVLIWAGAPTLALTLGAAPFLKESTLQRA